MTIQRVVFHCGLQKTASTSLHHFLQRNADALPAGLVALTPAKGSLTRQMGRAAIQYSLDPKKQNRSALVEAVRIVVASAPEGTQTLLISHENLPGAMPGCLGELRLYPMLEAMFDLLGEAVAPLVPEFVLYTRDMQGWKASVYNQAVKTDRYAGTYETFLSETAQIRNWADLRDRTLRHLGARGHVLRLEDERDATRPGWQLLRLVGLTDDAIASLEPVKSRSNPSLSSSALEFMRLVNGLGLPGGAQHKIERLVQEHRDLFREN